MIHLRHPLQHYIYRLVFRLSLLSAALPLSAQYISPTEALSIAQHQYEAMTAHPQGRTTQHTDATLQIVKQAQPDEATYLIAGEGQFWVVGAQRQLPQILGYGETDAGTVQDLPQGLQTLLHTLDVQYRTVRGTSRTSPTPHFFPSPPRVLPIAPFLHRIRHQESPFNDDCPQIRYGTDSISAQRALVGCVATSLEQVMGYYRYPTSLRDTLHGWTTPGYTIPDVLPGTPLPWEATLADYRQGYTTEQGQAVARISYLAGMAARMQWGLTESGSTLTAPISALRGALGYGYVRYVDSYLYTPQDWYDMLYAELAAHRPIIYAASMMRNKSHAFVLDGIDATGRVHVDWGMGGHYNGYFALHILNPFMSEDNASHDTWTQLMGLFCNQQALFLHPKSLSVALPDTLHRQPHDIEVRSITYATDTLQAPVGIIHLHVHNTTTDTLVTPLGIIATAAHPLADLSTGTLLAMTGCTLPPLGDDTLSVLLTLPQAGDYRLHLTPDGETTIYTTDIHVAPAPTTPLQITLQQAIVDSTQIRLILQLYNPDPQRANSALLTHSLFEGSTATPETDLRQWHPVYIPPLQTHTDTVTWRALRPTTPYIVYVRNPWLPILTYACTTTDASLTGIASPYRTTSVGGAASWYDMQGRALETKPQRRGLYLRRTAEGWRKVMYDPHGSL